MKKALLIASIMAILFNFSWANNDNIFIVDNKLDVFEDLDGYPGRLWGKTSEKLYLSGGDTEINWLTAQHIDFTAVDFDGEQSNLYFYYYDNDVNPLIDIEILDRGSDYILSSTKPTYQSDYRKLSLKPIYRRNETSQPNIVLEFNPYIDDLINQVSQDSIMDLLGRLTGETSIVYNGQTDTIKTRYSGSEGVELAAAYVTEILESYGYSLEYHGYYGGTGRHITVYDENTAWCVTEGGEALKTSNGGVDWISLNPNTSSNLWGVENYGADLVWIAGNGGTIRFSDDGGQTFVSQSSGTGNFLFGVSFVNSQEGWIAGDGGMILHTIDGGGSWGTQSTPTSTRLYDVCFVDNMNGWAVGRNGVVIHTSDGGQIWENQTSNANDRLYSVDFTDANNGWLVGWSGIVRRTIDGGVNWQVVSLGNTEKYHVDFADADHGCIVGWNGEIFSTSDGGDTWDQRASGTISDFYGVAFADDLTGYAFGNSFLTKSTDGGITWINQTGSIETAWQNVIATKLGTQNPDEQVVVCAHLDCTSEQPENLAPGADDNGSGSVGVIEAARIFSGIDFGKTIKFCLWTGEEQGLLGSEAYAGDAAARGDNILGALNFDMIGWDGDSDGSCEIHCGTMTASIALGDMFIEIINDYDIGLVPEQLTFNSTDRSDHASFWEFDYPAILGIEDFSSDFHPYYHTTGDNVSNINQDFYFEYVKAIIGAAATFAEPDSAAVSVDEPANLPNGFTLHGNYPNPFNAATTISFNVPFETEIELVVYDIMGRKIKTLYSGLISAGTQRITWNADDVASGPMFYKLSSENYTATGRMILLK